MFLKNAAFAYFFALIFTVSHLYTQQKYSDTEAHPPNNFVNSVLGDESYIEAFGVLPDKNTDEKTRIRTHLEYVERILKNTDIGGYSEALAKKREVVISHLHNYIGQEKYPVNYEYKNERKPCFIDKYGNICAVGYLVEQTAGRESAEKINVSYKYSYIYDIKDESLAEWIKHSGLTLKECVMIQPSYGEMYSGEKLTTEYALTSSFFAGFNLSLSALNTISIAKGERSFSRGFIGIISGVSQIALGLLNITADGYYFNPSETRKMVGVLNVSLGTVTTILSMINLLSDDKPKSSGGKPLILKFK